MLVAVLILFNHPSGLASPLANSEAHALDQTFGKPLRYNSRRHANTKFIEAIKFGHLNTPPTFTSDQARDCNVLGVRRNFYGARARYSDGTPSHILGCPL